MSETLTAPVQTGTWTLDPSHSTVGFVVRHLGFSKVRGGFTRFEGSLEVAEDVTATTGSVTIHADSFDSDDADRDGHVKSADFLDVETHPTLDFTIAEVRPRGEDRYTVAGDLTILGVTKRVELDAEFLGVDTDPFGNVKAGVEATTEINREDFGLTWNATLESGGLLVGKTVQIVLELQFSRA